MRQRDRHTTEPLSVVIPAHNEEATIRACLDALHLDLIGDEIIVVANGCTDRTAAVAAGYSGVHVIDLAEASKSAALNAGDAVASYYPRVYLDADICVDAATIRMLGNALSVDYPLAASPRVAFDTSRSSNMVRAFYRVYELTPYVRNDMVGLGVYGLSAHGRQRFARFPDLVSDDLYIQRLFATHERLTTPGSFTVNAPRDLKNLLRVRVRIAQGNRGLRNFRREPQFARSTVGTSQFLAGLVRRRPGLAPSVLVYIGVTVTSRLRARTASSDKWQRDVSTRDQAVGATPRDR